MYGQNSMSMQWKGMPHWGHAVFETKRRVESVDGVLLHRRDQGPGQTEGELLRRRRVSSVEGEIFLIQGLRQDDLDDAGLIIAEPFQSQFDRSNGEEEAASAH